MAFDPNKIDIDHYKFELHDWIHGFHSYLK